MIGARIAGVGVLGPGLAGWPASVPVLRGERAYAAGEIALTPPSFLSARERRRTGQTVRLALATAAEAVAHSGLPAASLASVFATANGDGQVLHKLLDALSQDEKLLSPTQFHNSVHNAAVGYWSIGVASHEPTSCIAGHDFTFPAALLKALTQVACEDKPVLMVVHDAPFPEPLNSARPMAPAPFGVALVLLPTATKAGFAELSLLGLRNGAAPPSPPRLEALQTLWSGNPAARALPLLEALAAGRREELAFQYPVDGLLRVGIAPC